MRVTGDVGDVSAPVRDAGGNALWGTWRRGIVLLLCLVVALIGGGTAEADSTSPAFVPPSLSDTAQASPSTAFRVIVQGTPGSNSGSVRDAVKSVEDLYPDNVKGVLRRFTVLSGISAELSGRQISALANSPKVAAITPDARVFLTGFSNKQKWPDAAQVSSSWLKVLKGIITPPTIAVIDSGVDASHPDLKGRVAKQVTLTSLTPNSSGDGRGHGTFVAGIAAGIATGYTGAIPTANIVSLDVLDDNGMGLTSDVIAACDWILENKANLNIRVANLSLNSATASTFLYDPLDKAVERLWLNGVTAVTAAGNYAVDGQPSGVLYAPANDPFVLTVGASDTAGDSTPSNDVAAPWSAYGYTADGFYKPELGAPGRYLNGPVPKGATMLAEHPERTVAPGYMWMSGTSFAAPVVSGAAAYVLAIHPKWTPDQVKGALMVRAAVPSGYAAPGALGVGVLQADYSAFLADGSANPNLGLDAFVTTDPLTGTKVFDSASWSEAAKANASWDAASWSGASWGGASWNEASWSEASWSEASWNTASWSEASWATSATSSAIASWAALTWVG